MTTVSLLIPQYEGFGASKIAYLQADVKVSSWTDHDVFEAITAAVTDWANKTSVGLKVLLASVNHDLNIGDVALYQGNASLQGYLAQHGIINLRIEVYTAKSVSFWNFDTSLIGNIAEET